MKSEISEIQKKSDRQNEIKFRNKLYIFIVCIVISAFVWTLIKFSKDYTTVLKYPVIFKNIPANRVLVNYPDSTISLTVTAKGFKLIYNEFFNKPYPLEIDLSTVHLKRKGDFYYSNLFTTTVTSELSKQLMFPNNIVSIDPDTLTFTFEKRYFKKVPVESRLEMNFKKQYQLYDSIKFSPDSVTISGSLNDIKKISSVKTEQKVLKNLSSSEFVDLNIELPKKLNVSVSPKKIVGYVNVEKFTESNIEIPINHNADKVNKSIKLFPNKVNVSYLVALKDYKKINEGMFWAFVDFSKLDLKSADNKVKIVITKFPSFTKITKIDPEKVEFIINTR